jgi:hypothetical protein
MKRVLFLLAALLLPIGAGWMFPLSRGTSFVLGANYGLRIFASDYYGTFGVTVGTLF